MNTPGWQIARVPILSTDEQCKLKDDGWMQVMHHLSQQLQYMKGAAACRSKDRLSYIPLKHQLGAESLLLQWSCHSLDGSSGFWPFVSRAFLVRRDWSRMQTMLQLEKEHIVDIVRCVFDKVDSQSHGCLPWPNLGEAMLLLCGKHFSVREFEAITRDFIDVPAVAPEFSFVLELHGSWSFASQFPPLMIATTRWQEIEVAALCKHHMFVAGSELSKVQFQEVAFDGLFLVAQEELRNGDTVNSAGLPRCAQVVHAARSIVYIVYWNSLCLNNFRLFSLWKKVTKKKPVCF